MNEELKEQKPKKIFTITVDIYDTGDIDETLVEYRQNKTVGRPKKWLLSAPDFVKRVEETYGNFDAMLEDCNKAIGKGSKDLLGFKANNVGGVEIKVVPRLSEPKKDVPEVKDEDLEDEKPDDGSDINFGEFDPNK